MLKKNNAAYTNKIEKDGYLILRKYLSKKKCDYFKKKLEAHYTKFSKKYANKKISKNSLANKTKEKWCLIYITKTRPGLSCLKIKKNIKHNKSSFKKRFIFK